MQQLDYFLHNTIDVVSAIRITFDIDDYYIAKMNTHIGEGKILNLYHLFVVGSDRTFISFRKHQ